MPNISRQEASDLLEVHPDTLKRWEEEGKIVSERTTGGHRRYDAAKLLGTSEKEGKTICYAGVSTRPQKEDLQHYCDRVGWLLRKTGMFVQSNYTDILHLLNKGKVGSAQRPSGDARSSLPLR